MDPVEEGVRLACLVLLSTKSTKEMRETAVGVIRSAAAHKTAFVELDRAYTMMTLRRDEMRVAGRAIDALFKACGSPLWSGDVNKKYSDARAEASAAYELAKKEVCKADTEFTQLANQFCNNSL